MQAPYRVISPHPRGSYGWAMDQLEGYNVVRRRDWPIEVEQDRFRIWKVYKLLGGGLCKGFNSGVVGADNDSWGDLGIDSHGYSPTLADIEATDWQLVSDVDEKQIAWLDAHRMKRTPSQISAEMQHQIRRQDRFYAFTTAACVAVLIVVALAIWRW